MMARNFPITFTLLLVLEAALGVRLGMWIGQREGSPALFNAPLVGDLGNCPEGWACVVRDTGWMGTRDCQADSLASYMRACAYVNPNAVNPRWTSR